MDRKSISRGVRLSDAHVLYIQGTLLCKNLSNKLTGSVIFRLITNRKSVSVEIKLSATHAFNYYYYCKLPTAKYSHCESTTWPVSLCANYN